MKIPFDHFDLLAPVYETFIHPGINDEFWKVADIPESGYILDAGGGTGRVSQAIRHTGIKIIVSDLSFPMLLEVKTKPPIIPVQTPTEKLPFKSNIFDRIIMVDALHHVINQKLTILELWRVLKPGGVIIIEEPDISSWKVKLLALAEKLALMRSHFINAEKITGIFPCSDTDKKIIARETNFWIRVSKTDPS